MEKGIQNSFATTIGNLDNYNLSFYTSHWLPIASLQGHVLGYNATAQYAILMCKTVTVNKTAKLPTDQSYDLSAIHFRHIKGRFFFTHA